MKVSYLGHSSFLLRSEGGTSIVTDPYGGIGLVFPRVKADGVTVSHGHFDHCEVSAVEGAPVVFDRAGSYSLGDVQMSAFLRDHDGAQGRLRGKNLVFRFEIDGMTVCHLGDIGEPFSQELAAQIGQVDVLFIPVGGNYTIDAFEAKKYVDGLAPKIVIPMHYKVEGLTVDIAAPDAFLRLFEEVERRGGAEFSGSTLGQKIKIVLLERES